MFSHLSFCLVGQYRGGLMYIHNSYTVMAGSQISIEIESLVAWCLFCGLTWDIFTWLQYQCVDYRFSSCSMTTAILELRQCTCVHTEVTGYELSHCGSYYDCWNMSMDTQTWSTHGRFMMRQWAAGHSGVSVHTESVCSPVCSFT